MNPALTTGARNPNHCGLEKWKKTILTAAKQRKPVKAFNGAGLVFGVLREGFHEELDVSERTGNRD